MTDTKDTWRGHQIEQNASGVWLYVDSGQPVSNNRACGHCKKPNREDGHDACLGVLPGVMNACCGHGVPRCAYVQFSADERIGGAAALRFIARLIADGVQ